MLYLVGMGQSPNSFRTGVCVCKAVGSVVRLGVVHVDSSDSRGSQDNVKNLRQRKAWAI